MGQGKKRFNLKDSRFRLYLRKKFFTVRVMRHWHRFHKFVDVSSLEVFEVRLDGASRNLVWWKVSLCLARDLE